MIENRGNADWRTRGRAAKGTVNSSPHRGEGEAGAGAVVEREETSKKAGLQFAEKNETASATTTTTNTTNGQPSLPNGHSDHLSTRPEKAAPPPQTADQAALSAPLLLLDGNKAPDTFSSTTIIPHPPSTPLQAEPLSFLTDLASRPDPCTISEYAAMPVEEFGMALLRGMGKKRRANGEVIVIKNPHEEMDEEEKKREKEVKRLRDPGMGFLGVGAKAVKIGGAGGGEKGGGDGLGAWGKSDMRRRARNGNGKGGGAGADSGLYTPVLLRDRRTGELITERELEERKKMVLEANGKRDGGGGGGGEEDWRDRRDRNLDRNGLGGGGGGSSSISSSRRQIDVDDRARHDRDKKHNGPPPFPRRKMIEDATTTRDSPSRGGHSLSNSSSRRRRAHSRSRSRSRSRSKDRERDRDSSVTRERYRARDRDRDRVRDRDRDRDRDGRRRERPLSRR